MATFERSETIDVEQRTAKISAGDRLRARKSGSEAESSGKLAPSRSEIDHSLAAMKADGARKGYDNDRPLSMRLRM